MDDVGITPYAALDAELSVDDAFPMQLFEYLRAFINKLPVDKHYIAIPVEYAFGNDINVFQVHIFVFDDYVAYSDYIEVTAPTYYDGYVLSYTYPLKRNSGMLFNYSSFQWEKLKVSPIEFTYTLRYGYTQTLQPFSAPFSDVGKVYPDISNRREVVAQYATVFGLAVFFILGILRGFWRSARGRDT